MPSNFTENYDLSQWERTDKVQMEDFNEDNAKIDAALKAEADARTAADSAINAMLAKCGNCRLYVGSYVGTGTYGADNPTRISFPWRPELILLVEENSREVTVISPVTTKFTWVAGAVSQEVKISWSGNTMSIVAPYYISQFNSLNTRYYAYGFAVKK